MCENEKRWTTKRPPLTLEKGDEARERKKRGRKRKKARDARSLGAWVVWEGLTLLFTLLFGGVGKNHVWVVITVCDWLTEWYRWQLLHGQQSQQNPYPVTNSQSQPVITTHTWFFPIPPNNNVFPPSCRVKKNAEATLRKRSE